jgi:hypothetical protein
MHLCMRFFKAFIDAPLDSKTIDQLRVDIKFGGLSLTDCHTSSPAAYTSSCINSLSDICTTFPQTYDTHRVVNLPANYATEFGFISKYDLMASMWNSIIKMVMQHVLTTESHERADSEAIIWQQSRKNSIHNSFSGAWLSAFSS